LRRWDRGGRLCCLRFHQPRRSEGDLEVEDVVLEALPGEDFAAQILDPQGAPVPNAELKFAARDTPIAVIPHTTDEDGRVRVPRLPPASYELTVKSLNERLTLSLILEWRGSEEPLVLQLEPANP
jgi:hypothetical protein